jgi:hypothetical protein
MTACASVRRLMLEAETDELRGIGSNAVAAHIRDCPSCARLATRILEETAALDDYLTAEAGADAVDVVLRRAGIASSPSAVAPSRSRPAWARPSAWVALATAASVTLLLIIRERPPAPAPTAVALAVEGASPLVQSSSERTVAVMQTDNPDITVLWFFQGGGDR